ncbi:hypothetical protein D0867_16002, partial [Hortaea werneckii]
TQLTLQSARQFRQYCPESIEARYSKRLLSISATVLVKMPSDMAEYWRDVQADRKRRQLEEPEAHDPATRPCYDWYLDSGNVHFARDQSAFTSYVPLNDTTLSSVAFDQTVGAAGIGHVELRVKISPQSDETRTLQLRDVFHIPTAPCNGLSDMEIGIEHNLTVSYGRPYWTMHSSDPEETPPILQNWFLKFLLRKSGVYIIYVNRAIKRGHQCRS